MFQTNVLQHVGAATESAVTPPSMTGDAFGPIGSGCGWFGGGFGGGLWVAQMRTDTNTYDGSPTCGPGFFDFLDFDELSLAAGIVST